jgi:hypothetical protein
MSRAADLEREHNRSMQAAGEALWSCDLMAADGGPGDIRLDSVKVKLDADNRTSVLLVLSGSSSEGEFVAFVGGLTAVTAFQALRKQYLAKRIRWRPSIPWDSRPGR